jgi:hypothetical protein
MQSLCFNLRYSETAAPAAWSMSHYVQPQGQDQAAATAAAAAPV